MIQIKHLNGKVLCEGPSLLDAIRKANKEGISLIGAYLKGANLEGANVYGANLRGAILEGADLEGANLRGANLEGANLRGANLEGASLKGANLKAIKKDFLKVLKTAKPEIVGLYQALLEGRIDGSAYEGECACLKGTIANIRHCSYKDLKPDSDSPVERWFLGIQEGDTPENNQVSDITVGWLKEFAEKEGIKLPTRKVAGG